jgi:hypothetical protein
VVVICRVETVQGLHRAIKIILASAGIALQAVSFARRYCAGLAALKIDGTTCGWWAVNALCRSIRYEMLGSSCTRLGHRRDRPRSSRVQIPRHIDHDNALIALQ